MYLNPYLLPRTFGFQLLTYIHLSERSRTIRQDNSLGPAATDCVDNVLFIWKNKEVETLSLRNALFHTLKGYICIYISYIYLIYIWDNHFLFKISFISYTIISLQKYLEIGGANHFCMAKLYCLDRLCLTKQQNISPHGAGIGRLTSNKVSSKQ